MRRWNGWGDDRVVSHLPDSAASMLRELVGATDPGVTCSIDDLLKRVPDSRLPDHPLVDRSPEVRLRHARGQSFPDWVALRHGSIDRFPDAVAFPRDSEEVRAVMRYAVAAGATVIPYGGGTSVVGHLTPGGAAPVLSVSMARCNQLLHLDASSRLARFGAGITGPDLEATLRAHGYTLGHFPQSFEYSTLGGWVVTRSSGQQSLGYGRIEDGFAGGLLLSPEGELTMPPLPASSAGPDLRQLVLGSEGRMGILSEATIRLHALPEAEVFHAWFFPHWEAASNAVRALSQAGIPMSMMRLSNPLETTTNLTLAGDGGKVRALKKYMRLRGLGDEACMLLVGFSGLKSLLSGQLKAVKAMCPKFRGVHLHQPLGRAWRKNRFRAPYLRNILWEKGYGVDTLETCVTWDRATQAMHDIEAALAGALDAFEERIHVFTHLSHFYRSGCSIYTTYLFRLCPDPEEMLARWRALKSAACEAIVRHGGTISHQHGVGTDHLPYLPAEKGPLGMDTLATLVRHFDPKGQMNPGKLLAP